VFSFTATTSHAASRRICVEELPGKHGQDLFNGLPLADLPIIFPAWTRHTAEALIIIAAIALREGKRRGSGTAQLITHRNRARDLEHLRLEADPPGRFIPIGEETESIHLAQCSDTSARALQTRAAAV
jgi:hypothetical protein